jgi:hypothetical protein
MMGFGLDGENHQGLNDDEDEEDHSSRRVCVDCGSCAPKTQTAHTLISSKHGWRLTRARMTNDEGYLFQWRCPKCWATHKSKSPDSARH